MGFQGNFTEEFSTQVLQRLKMPMKTIAYGLGVSYKTYYNWVTGISTYPPDLIAKLYQITKDSRIFRFFLEPCEFIALKDLTRENRRMVANAIEALKTLGEFLRKF